MDRSVGLLDYRTNSRALSWADTCNSFRGARPRKRQRLKKPDVVALSRYTHKGLNERLGRSDAPCNNFLRLGPCGSGRDCLADLRQILRTGLGWQSDHFLGFFVVTSLVAWPRPLLAWAKLMATSALLLPPHPRTKVQTLATSVCSV